MENTTLSTQLRIGNWLEVFTVKNRWEQLQIRSGLDIEEVMKAEEDPDDDRFRPIELDEKWLVKFGFIEVNGIVDNQGDRRFELYDDSESTIYVSYGSNFVGNCDSGLSHHKHLKGHPFKNTSVLMPGPS